MNCSLLLEVAEADMSDDEDEDHLNLSLSADEADDLKASGADAMDGQGYDTRSEAGDGSSDAESAAHLSSSDNEADMAGSASGKTIHNHSYILIGEV